MEFIISPILVVRTLNEFESYVSAGAAGSGADKIKMPGGFYLLPEMNYNHFLNGSNYRATQKQNKKRPESGKNDVNADFYRTGSGVTEKGGNIKSEIIVILVTFL